MKVKVWAFRLPSPNELPDPEILVEKGLTILPEEVGEWEVSCPDEAVVVVEMVSAQLKALQCGVIGCIAKLIDADDAPFHKPVPPIIPSGNGGGILQ